MMMRLRDGMRASALAAVALSASPSFAEEESETRVLRAELQALKAEQARLQDRISRLEGRLVADSPAVAASLPAAPSAPVATVPAAAAAGRPASRFEMSGDLRLRQEFNQGGAPSRQRQALRARVRGTYRISDVLTAGAQIVTGDPDDPNSTDVTLSNFSDNFTLSADQIYLRANLGAMTVVGGKFPQPFLRTDLVWDGDVSPQGAAFAYARDLDDRLALSLRGIYFAIDEAVAGPDSYMVGAQAVLTGEGAGLRLQGALAYYDYTLDSLAGGDAGDFRTNRMGPDGRYLSDFNLVDAMLQVDWATRSSWPVRLTADYVRNLGAAGDDDGYSLEAAVGDSGRRGGLRLSYGYSEAQTDAILTAFSHDNTDLASNYRQHAITADYGLSAKMGVGLNYFRYRQLEARDAAWRQRLRLYLLMQF